MKYNQQKTFQLKTADKKPKWFLLDAKGKTLGRLASEITKILRGKHRPTFTTYIDGGDGVIVINAGDVVVTGNKEADKIYRNYTGFMSGMREIPYREMKARHPEYMVEHAVKCMMPRTRIADAQLKKLRVFAKPVHDMQAQQPITVNI
jgi:large subunit ribosomal protein L13